MGPDDIARVIAHAREGGFSGFGGACGEAAVALNRVLFGGRGNLVGAFNKAFQDHGQWIGHVAVRFEGVHWDADARPKEFEDIETWGMLDPEDTDYRERAEAAGFDWDDEAAEEVVGIEFDDESEVLAAFGEARLESLLAAIAGSMEAHGLAPGSDHAAPGAAGP